MTGFMQLLMYPNQVVRRNAVTPGRQESLCNFMHIASMILHVKKGTQHIRNTPEKRKESITLWNLKLKLNFSKSLIMKQTYKILIF